MNTDATKRRTASACHKRYALLWLSTPAPYYGTVVSHGGLSSTDVLGFFDPSLRPPPHPRIINGVVDERGWNPNAPGYREADPLAKEHKSFDSWHANARASGNPHGHLDVLSKHRASFEKWHRTAQVGGLLNLGTCVLVRER